MTASGEMWFEYLRNEYIFFPSIKTAEKKKNNCID